MSRISQTADRFRREVIRRELEASHRLVSSYGSTYQALSDELQTVTRQCIQLEKEGKAITKNLIYRRTRIQELLRIAEEQVAEFSKTAQAQVSLEQAFAIERAQYHAEQLVLTAIGPLPNGLSIPSNFLGFNPEVVQKFIGRASNGSPLRELFETFGSELPNKIEQIFVNGIVKGLNPLDVARELNKKLDLPLKRAQTISRTEVLNSYRETNREHYQQNATVVKRWRWQAAFNKYTCAMCLAMDGREFPTDEPMGTHPNCRCVLVPVTASWKELGFDVPDRRSKPSMHGEEWFSKQPDATKLFILGPEKLARYNAGEITLRDMVGVRNDADWGLNRWERSLVQIDAGTFAQKGNYWGIMPDS